jgi:hypothetical protein
MRSPRIHHYRFAFIILPDVVFTDPPGFLDLLEPPHGVAYLEQLWERVGSELAEPVALAEGSFAVDLAKLQDRRAAIVTFPPPVAPPEAYFAAVVEASPGTPDEWRYFVLEDIVADGEPRGVLCEWFADGSRRNLSHEIVPSLAAFSAIVESELAREESRDQAGIAATISPRWRPSDDSPPDAIDSLFSTSFRGRLCAFAYYTLPNAIFTKSETLLGLRNVATRDEIIRQLWREAASRCGTVWDAPPEPPQAAWLQERSMVVVAMPQPLAPPEPFYVAVPETSAAIYTLELASENLNAPPIVARIDPDGTHAVLAAAHSADLELFLDAAESHARGEPPSFDSGQVDTTAQLTRYAVLHGQIT